MGTLAYMKQRLSEPFMTFYYGIIQYRKNSWANINFKKFKRTN